MRQGLWRRRARSQSPWPLQLCAVVISRVSEKLASLMSDGARAPGKRLKIPTKSFATDCLRLRCCDLCVPVWMPLAGTWADGSHPCSGLAANSKSAFRLQHMQTPTHVSGLLRPGPRLTLLLHIQLSPHRPSTLAVLPSTTLTCYTTQSQILTATLAKSIDRLPRSLSTSHPHRTLLRNHPD